MPERLSGKRSFLLLALAAAWSLALIFYIHQCWHQSAKIYRTANEIQKFFYHQSTISINDAKPYSTSHIVKQIEIQKNEWVRNFIIALGLMALLLSTPILLTYKFGLLRKYDVGLFFAIISLCYFIYQIAAGNLFATTSISIHDAKWCIGEHYIQASAEIERGSYWTSQIMLDQYAVTDLSETKYPFDSSTGYVIFKFPRRHDGMLVLAPEEKSEAEFLIWIPKSYWDKSTISLTARVISYDTFWPVPSESFTSVVVRKGGEVCNQNTEK